jgi:hypothetical protein
MEELQVFLISPLKVIVYNLDDPQTNNKYTFNAELLKLIPDPMIESYKEISGNITQSFGVKPVVLGYENDKLELVYAPRGLNYVFRSDGRLASHGRSQVILKSAPIKIPNIGDVNLSVASDSLPEIKLGEPDAENIMKYIKMSQQGIEYNIKSTYDELKKPKVNLPSSIKPSAPVAVEIIIPQKSVPVTQQPVLPPIIQTSLPQNYDDMGTPARGMKSPTPRIIKTKPEVVIVNDNKEVEKLKLEVIELRALLKAFMQRNYQLYPVDSPNEFTIDGKTGPVIKLAEVQAKMANNEIERMILDPLLQPYAGSNRNTNRFLTFYEKNGNICHVRASYDPKTNALDNPK